METKTILVVEDNPAIQRLLVKTLESSGHTILVANNGQEAIGIIHGNAEIDLIFLDIMMPKLNGMELLDKIKDIKNENGFKVCMLTAKGQSEDIKTCLKLGADDYLKKPIDTCFLFDKISTLLSDDDSDYFTSVKTKMEGEIKLIDGSIPVLITELSESSLVITSEIQLPLGAKIQLDSADFEKMLGLKIPLFYRVFSCEFLNGFYCSHITFIAPEENISSKIRSITQKGVDLHE